MPRQSRLKLAGFPLHIVQRGNNRSPCFFGVADYAVYLRLLLEHAQNAECAVHAYVLMTNHVHLLLTPVRSDSASLLMKQLAQRYVQYVNRRYGRSGSLWDGRFHSSIVDHSHYLLACYRYIETNPVRAGMVRDASEYRWSSHRINAGAASSLLVTPHAAYAALGEDEHTRQNAYRCLFQTPLADSELGEIRKASAGGHVLGRRGFKAGVAAVLSRPVEARRRGRRPGAAEIRDRPLFLIPPELGADPH